MPPPIVTKTLRGRDSYIAWCFHIYGWPKRTSQKSIRETSHNTSSLKGWIPYDNRHGWLTKRSCPWRSHPMLYGCGCGVFDNPNYLMKSSEMRLFWLSLSTIKCSGVPFTHICEWKKTPSFFWICWFFWLNSFDCDNRSGVCIDDMSSPIIFWIRLWILV